MARIRDEREGGMRACIPGGGGARAPKFASASASPASASIRGSQSTPTPRARACPRASETAPAARQTHRGTETCTHVPPARLPAPEPQCAATRATSVNPTLCPVPRVRWATAPEGRRSQGLPLFGLRRLSPGKSALVSFRSGSRLHRSGGLIFIGNRSAYWANRMTSATADFLIFREFRRCDILSTT